MKFYDCFWLCLRGPGVKRRFDILKSALQGYKKRSALAASTTRWTTSCDHDWFTTIADSSYVSFAERVPADVLLRLEGAEIARAQHSLQEYNAHTI
jgi:hypothetical protein